MEGHRLHLAQAPHPPFRKTRCSPRFWNRTSYFEPPLDKVQGTGQQAISQFLAKKALSLGRIPMARDTRASICGIDNDREMATLVPGASSCTRIQRHNAEKLGSFFCSLRYLHTESCNVTSKELPLYDQSVPHLPAWACIAFDGSCRMHLPRPQHQTRRGRGTVKLRSRSTIGWNEREPLVSPTIS